MFAVAVQQVQAVNAYGVGSLLNGGIGDMQVQQGVVHNNLVSLGAYKPLVLPGTVLSLPSL